MTDTTFKAALEVIEAAATLARAGAILRIEVPIVAASWREAASYKIAARQANRLSGGLLALDFYERPSTLVIRRAGAVAPPLEPLAEAESCIEATLCGR